MKPRFPAPNLARLGKITGISAGPTPNHAARVAEYWSTDTDGIQTPPVPASSGPPRTRVGKFPCIVPPFTAPPTTK